MTMPKADHIPLKDSKPRMTATESPYSKYRNTRERAKGTIANLYFRATRGFSMNRAIQPKSKVLGE